MQNTWRVDSPLGEILLAGSGDALTGLWFVGQKYFAASLDHSAGEAHLAVFTQTEAWLRRYFDGHDPGFAPPLAYVGTPFRCAVWEILRTIPFGTTMTYAQIAAQIARQRALPHMSAQAVGNAVGHNPVSLIIPCHRVIGSDGSLTGYAGGLDKKRRLLAMEGALPRRAG